MPRTLTVIALLLWAGPGKAAPGVLELIPDDANAALMIRSITELKKKGDQFLADTEIDLGIRPTQALAFVYNYLGIGAGVDENGPAGLLLVDEKHRKKNAGDRLFDRRLVLLVSFSDRDKMAANFKLKPGALEPDKVLQVEAGGLGTAFVAVRDRQLILGIDEEAVRSVSKSTSLAKALAPERVRSLESADILLHFSPHGDLGMAWKETLAKEERSAAVPQDVDPEVRRQLFETLASLQYLFVTIGIDDGLHLRALTAFSKEMPETAKQFLTGLAGRAGASSLAGLPDGPAVAAQAAHGDGAQSALVLKLLFHYVLQGTGERIPFWATHLDPSQRLTVVGVVTEIWKHLHGHRAAIYRNAEPAKQGLFSVVAILDTADAGRLLGEVKQLARFASKDALDLSDKPAARDEVQLVKQLIQDLDDRQFLVRQSATTKLELIGEPVVPYLKETLASKPSLELRRRADGILARIATAVAERRTGLFSDATKRLQPSFAYLAQAEKVGETPVDVLRIKLSDKDIPATTQFRQFFGPDWDKVRVAVHGKQVVLLWGSDKKLLAEALRNVSEARPGLAEAKQFGSFARSADPGRKIEFHASIQTLLGLARADDLKTEMQAKPALTSLSLGVHADRMQYDLRLPVSEIKFLYQEVTRRDGR
jgi:hypothetical protein